MAGEAGADSVAILLSTYNGEPFLREQLHSLLSQTHRNWTLYWRDDGSTDQTQQIVSDFLTNLPQGNAVTLPDDGRRGATESFLRLLLAACSGDHAAFAFADQDDVWLPNKLERGMDALKSVADEKPPNGGLEDELSAIPALYCAPHILVDEGLRPIALSRPVRRQPGFPAALTQNIASGCTIMMNRSAAVLASSSHPPAGAFHDWWCYLLVSAAGGLIIADDVPTILYRQHGGNVVGAPASDIVRLIAAIRRGPQSFMDGFRRHVAALSARPDMLSPVAAAQLAELEKALRGGRLNRLHALRMSGLVRQTTRDTAMFRLWFLLG